MERWDDLHLLLALSRNGTLSGAGRELGVHVSTVGRRLDAMEEGLGVRLFDRTPDGVLPTAAAEELVPWALEVERRVDDVKRVIEGMEDEAAGVVRVSAPPGLASDFLAPMAVELRRTYPQLKLRIDAAVGYADLTRREADIALRAFRPESGDLVSKRLVVARASVFASRARAEEIGRIRSLDELEWITYGEELAHIPDASWILEQVSYERVALVSNSIHVQYQACRSGMGALVTATESGLRAGLSPIPLCDELVEELRPLPEYALWLVGHRALRRVPRVEAVWTALETLFVEQPTPLTALER